MKNIGKTTDILKNIERYKKLFKDKTLIFYK